jgi:mycothiol synthase
VSDIDRIRKVAEAAEATDGSAPLDEATWLSLRRGLGVYEWVTAEGFALVIGDDLSVCVDPDHRGQGLGERLLEQALAERGHPGLQAWSHCDHPAAARLAEKHGFAKVRELWVMRRPTSEPLPVVPVLTGAKIRSFLAGDEDELIRVNSAAFATHPEQGGMDAGNLAERMAQAWYEPEGLLVADAGEGRLLGYHWTKRHSPDVGEVYVVGVDPAAQGTGVGRALTVAGLKHLAARGVDEVILYVESDNEPAKAVYTKLGFTHAPEDTHVRYRRG